MGLMIHSLEEISPSIKRDYYIYLLDYGWKEPLSNIIIDNFDRISSKASMNKSVFIKGTIGSHVDNEILSWHHINGEDGENVLPSILITKLNPHLFKELNVVNKENNDSKIILIPLKKYCKSSTDVISLINQIFYDISANKELKNFKIAKKMNRGLGKRFLDGVILKPSFSGIGFDLNKFFQKK
jgi:hypothetical protein